MKLTEYLIEILDFIDLDRSNLSLYSSFDNLFKSFILDSYLYESERMFLIAIVRSWQREHY
jgi:hypothetical protein